MNKWILTILLILGSLYLGIWFFNHINAWLGIGYVLLTIYISVKTILKQLKN